MRLFVAFALCLLLLPPLARAQDDDGGFLTRTIQDALSGAGRDVRIVGFAGALSSEATFERMTIADAEGIWLELEDVALNWRRLALLRGRLEVDSLTAQSLRVSRLPITEEEDTVVPSAEAEPFSLQLPELPVTINIANFEVAEIDLGEPLIGEPVRLALKASAVLNENGLDVDLEADRTDDKQGRFEISASVVREGAEIGVNLLLDEAEGGIAARLMNLPGLPSVNLSVAGSGPLDDFATDIALATDGQPRLAGQVELLAEVDDPDEGTVNRRILADLGGDITPLIPKEYQDFFGDDVGLTVNTLLFAGGEVDVEEFSISAQALDLAGQVRLNAEKWPEFVAVKGRVAQASGSVVIPGTDAGVAVREIDMDVHFDAADDNSLRGSFIISDLEHDAAQVAQIRLSLDGLLEANAGALGRFASAIDFDARGIELSDDAAGQAVGDAVRGRARVVYSENAPIRIENLDVAGVDYGLNGQAVIAGLNNGFPTDLVVEVSAEDLSRFAGLAGQPIGGAAELSVAGSVTPLSSMFDLVIEGLTRDIVVEIPQADAVMQGQTNLSLVALRDEGGTFVRDLKLRNAALDVRADVTLRSNASQVEARVALSDIALVVPQYQGAVVLEAEASQTEEGWWQVKSVLDAPYDSRAIVSGLATGPQTDITFELAVPEVSALVAAVQGPLDAGGRVWLTTEGYRVDVAASGPFGADVDVEGLATGPDARVDLVANLPDMGVFVPELSGALGLTGEVARDGADAWALDTRLDGPAGMAADIDGTVAGDASTVDLAIVGQVPLGLAGPFVAPRSLTGPVSFDLSLRGAPALDALSGSITTSDVRFSDPELRLALNDIAARVDLANSTARFDVGADIAAGGRAEVGGSVNLVSLAGDIALGLRQAVLVDPNLYSATLNADIAVNGPLTGGARVSGRIDLGEVNVTVPGTGVTSIGSIPEIRHVGAPGRVTETRARAGVLPKETASSSGGRGPAYPLSIDVFAPSKIFVRGRGINAELGGNLQLRGTSNTPISTGSFDLIRGRLDIVGKRFDLDEGSVQFQGAVTPYILFVTTTEVPNGTASITVEGIATEPEITFSAVPEVPQDEVLSLILFGRYVSELSAFQALQLANGVSQLTGRGGVNVIGNLRDGIGLDELDVTTDEAGSTSVTAGKYITDNIYTDVTTNTEKGTDISLNIDLTNDLKGKATVAEDGDSSIGLFFERDY